VLPLFCLHLVRVVTKETKSPHKVGLRKRIVFVSYLELVFQRCVEESMRVVCDSYNKIPKLIVPISDNE
jgi:hypothetical protein